MSNNNYNFVTIYDPSCNNPPTYRNNGIRVLRPWARTQGQVCYNNCNLCVNPVFGCTYESATNYNSFATNDDMSCEFENTNGSSCNTDLNDDGVVSTGDLLLFLVSFGQLCE